MEVLCSEEVFGLDGWHICSNNNKNPVKDILSVDCIMNVEVSRRWSTLRESIEGISLFAGAEKDLRHANILARTSLFKNHRVTSGRGRQAVSWLQDRNAGVLRSEIFFRAPQGALAMTGNIGVDALVHEMRQTLEPTVGRSTEHSLSSEGRVGTRHDVGVAFHPRDCISGKSQAAKKHSDI